MLLSAVVGLLSASSGRSSGRKRNGGGVCTGTDGHQRNREGENGHQSAQKSAEKRVLRLVDRCRGGGLVSWAGKRICRGDIIAVRRTWGEVIFFFCPSVRVALEPQSPWRDGLARAREAGEEMFFCKA